MAMSIDNLISNYSYGYKNNLRPNLDKNSDSVWSAQEVQRFANDYEKSTGSTIDVDKLFESYDSNADGVMGASEIDSIYSDDALGLNALTTTETDDGDTLQLSDAAANWMENISDKDLYTMLGQSFQADMASSLINTMMPASNSMFTLNYAMTSYASQQALSSASSLFSRLNASM